MSKQHNYIVFDIETSGLKPEDGAEIVQLSAKAINFWDLKEHHAGTINLILKPNKPTIEDCALKVIGEELWTKACDQGLDQKVGLQRFVDWAATVNDSKSFWSKPYLVGFNNKSFDNPFLLYWLRHYGIITPNKKGFLDHPWSFFSHDLMDLYNALFECHPDLPNLKLDTFAALLGIQRSGDTHDAFEDVEIETELLVRYMAFMRKMSKRIKLV